MQHYRFSGSPRSFAHAMGVVIVVLVCANIARLILRFGFGYDYLMGLGDLLDFHQEGNIPTFFSVSLALFSVILLTIIAIDARHRASPDARYWFVLAGGFLFLAYDEAFQVHEKLMAPMSALLGESRSNLLHFSWVVPAGIAVILAIMYFLRFLLRMPIATRRRLLTAGMLFVGGAIGLELIGGAYFASYGDTLGYHLLVMVEEGLEMAGLATLIYALLGHMADSCAKLEFNLHAEQAVPASLMQGAQPELARAPG
jgi:hypothetical protein